MPMEAMTRVGKEATSDDELLLRCVEGDKAAFGDLFDRYSRQVYAAALITLHHVADAEDVLSETFLVFWRKRESIALFGGSALPWLVTTARNLARNYLRSQSRSRALSLDDSRATPSSDSADAMADARSLERRLGVELARLAPVDQRIVELCLLEGATYEQAGRLLGLSHAGVRNRLARARFQLRNNLNPERGER